MGLEDALTAAQKAVQFDSKHQYKQALYYYELATKRLATLPLDPTLTSKLSEYRERIATLNKLRKF